MFSQDNENPQNLSVSHRELKPRKKKNKTMFQNFMDGDSPIIFTFKFLLGGIFGSLMGYGYFRITFASAFTLEEGKLKDWVFSIIICLSTIACAVSVQCRCIAVLCGPAMMGKTGRGVLHGLLATWIISGPIANTMYHGTQAIASLTCIARMQSSQTSNLINLLHAPITAGYKSLVDEYDVVNESEHVLHNKLKHMSDDLWNVEGTNPEAELKVEEGDLGGKLHAEAHYRCLGMFQYGVDQCKDFLAQKLDECYAAIAIPIIQDILCLVLRLDFVCHSVNWFNSFCWEVPSVDNVGVQRKYGEMEKTSEDISQNFDQEMGWRVPKVNRETGTLTVDEVVEKVEGEIQHKKILFDVLIGVIKKIVAVSFILILHSATGYNTKYLTDFRFDNLYVTSYFVRKDTERKDEGKRGLLPLTNLEKRNLIFPLSIGLTNAENKAVKFKVVKLLFQAFFTTLLFIFDFVIYYSLSLILKHGKVDLYITGYHKLNVAIEGNGTVGTLLSQLFQPFKDNEHVLESKLSNLECLPKPKRTTNETMYWIIGMYTLILLTLYLDAYALRMRHFVASIAYRKREKARVIYLYSDVMRRRKNQVFHTMMSIQKLARNYRLVQRHSFAAGLKSRFPSCTYCFEFFNLGRPVCLICESSGTDKKPLVRCNEQKCRVFYCQVCWKEVGNICWACQSYAPTDEERERMQSERGNDDFMEELVEEEGSILEDEAESEQSEFSEEEDY